MHTKRIIHGDLFARNIFLDTIHEEFILFDFSSKKFTTQNRINDLQCMALAIKVFLEQAFLTSYNMKICYILDLLLENPTLRYIRSAIFLLCDLHNIDSIVEIDDRLQDRVKDVQIPEKDEIGKTMQ